MTLHGGEPLLAGPALISFAAECFKAVATPATRVRISIQTNGILRSDSGLDVAIEHDIRIGVSLDGGEDAHDRHRRYSDGRSSYRQVADGITALRQDPLLRWLDGVDTE